MITRLKFTAAMAAILLCASANAQQLHLYSKEEQAGMSHDGSIATMTTPSEIRELFENAGKTPKPTGHITYCNAGLQGIGARARALEAVGKVCGGSRNVQVLRAGPMVDAVKTVLGGKCVRSEMIVFRCDSAQRP